jgi:hypothetical protein
MNRVKVLPSNLARLIRYRCTCGHCEDLKDEKSLTSQRDEPFVLEGFHELV